MCRFSNAVGVPSTSAAPVLPPQRYRPYFLTALVVMFTTGAGWGLWFLVQIAIAGKVTSVSLHAINAHGQTVIYGFLGLFIMGFAYQAFPKLWQQPMAWPALCVPVLALNVTGMLLLSIGELIAEHPLAPGIVVCGGFLQTVSIATFVVQLLKTFRAGGSGLTATSAMMFAAAGFYLIHTPLNAWHTLNLSMASKYEAIHYTSVYQPALRYLQFHGMTMLMIFGVGARMLPNFFAIPRPSERKLWWILVACTLAVVAESVVFAIFRYTEAHWLAKYLAIPWLVMLVAVVSLVWPWKLWHPLPDAMGRIERIGKFVRASFIWLIVSLLMTLLQFPWSKFVVDVYFSHAWYGASRQAFTVGFATMMIMAFSSKVVPNLNGVIPNTLPRLTAVFALVNVGLGLHIILQIVSELAPVAARLLPLAGLMQCVGLGWWGMHLLSCIRQGIARNALAQSPRQSSLVSLKVFPSEASPPSLSQG